MPRPIDVTGETYHQLTAVEPAGRSKDGRLWKWECTCGNHIILPLGRVRSGNTKSCGCRYAVTRDGGKKNVKHGYHKTYQWKTYWGMKNRCELESHHAYKNYGGRGISIFKPWAIDCGAFCRWLDENLGPRPEGHTLDRIDNDGNYEPGNLRWASKLEQTQNRRSTK